MQDTKNLADAEEEDDKAFLMSTDMGKGCKPSIGIRPSETAECMNYDVCDEYAQAFDTVTAQILRWAP